MSYEVSSTINKTELKKLLDELKSSTLTAFRRLQILNQIYSKTIILKEN